MECFSYVEEMELHINMPTTELKYSYDTIHIDYFGS